MSLFNVMNIASTGMGAESTRLNTTASNIANANTVSSSAGETYRARYPVFASEMQKALGGQPGTGSGAEVGQGVKVLGIVESNKRSVSRSFIKSGKFRNNILVIIKLMKTTISHD